MPGAIGEQLPFLASMKAGFMAGAALPLPPQAKALAGVAGSLLAPFLVSSGSAMERKASEQLKRGDKVDINELGCIWYRFSICWIRKSCTWFIRIK